MTSSEDNDFQDIAARTRARVLQTIEKAGYAEGAYQGSESAFQTGFDQGFEEGLKQGRLIGIKAASLRSTGCDIDKQSLKKLLECKVCEEK